MLADEVKHQKDLEQFEREPLNYGQLEDLQKLDELVRKEVNTITYQNTSFYVQSKLNACMGVLSTRVDDIFVEMELMEKELRAINQNSRMIDLSRDAREEFRRMKTAMVAVICYTRLIARISTMHNEQLVELLGRLRTRGTQKVKEEDVKRELPRIVGEVTALGENVGLDIVQMAKEAKRKG